MQIPRINALIILPSAGPWKGFISTWPENTKVDTRFHRFSFRRAARLVALAEKTGLSIRYERSGTIVIKNKGATY